MCGGREVLDIILQLIDRGTEVHNEALIDTGSDE